MMCVDALPGVHSATTPAAIAGRWEQLLEAALDASAIRFHFQPVISCLDQSLLYREALARLELDGELVNAGLFLPLVERANKEIEFDRLIVARLLEQLQTQLAACSGPLSINLLPQSIRDDAFIDWLLSKLDEHPVQAARLIFEVPEMVVRVSHGKLKRLANGLKKRGAQLSIDHFGTTNSSFGYLSGLPLYSIKVDHSYIRDIQDNLDHQFFVQSLVRIAHSRGILLTAEMVEQPAQWDLLRSFQLDGGQGYYLGEPKRAEAAC
jgi:EAL domain-containing protein (putative c-di-GMP-specific phosphodiesterase class I)